MKNITIRRACPEDALIIKKIHVATYQKSYRGYVPDEYLDNMSLNADIIERTKNYLKTVECWLAFYVDAPAGFGYVGEMDDKTFEIQALYVHPDYQKHGIGSALVNYLCKSKKEKGYKKCVAWTMKYGPSVSFYEKTKFIRTNQEKLWKFEIPIIKLEKTL